MTQKGEKIYYLFNELYLQTCSQVLLQAVQVQATEHQTVLHQTTSNCPLPPCQEIQVYKYNILCHSFFTLIKFSGVD